MGWLQTLIPIVAPIALVAIVVFSRPRATNLELHKFYETKQFANAIKRETYKKLSERFLAREVRNKIWKKILKLKTEIKIKNRKRQKVTASGATGQ